jgi:lipopolysaccharide biosynthesis glycosyltransferase
MPFCCITYITDASYMFPTLVSAMQARYFSSTEQADVIIFCLDLDSSVERVFAPICAAEHIGLMCVNSSAVEGANAMLSRLFLNRFVPARYTQYLYLDGDVQIRGPLNSLIEASVPEGRFLAANDPLTFLLQDGSALSRDLGKHLRSIGLSDNLACSYFNSGVLRINKNGWDVIGESAWTECRKNAKLSRFPDQDVLNLVAGASRIPMSLGWNFPIFMRNSRVEFEINPRIYHFMSNPKPWQGLFPPWTIEAYKPYMRVAQLYPSLAPFYRPLPSHMRHLYQIKQHWKKAVETVSWGFSERRNRILRYESVCSL